MEGQKGPGGAGLGEDSASLQRIKSCQSREAPGRSFGPVGYGEPGDRELRDLPKVTQPFGRKPRTRTHASGLQSQCCWQHFKILFKEDMTPLPLQNTRVLGKALDGNALANYPEARTQNHFVRPGVWGGGSPQPGPLHSLRKGNPSGLFLSCFNFHSTLSSVKANKNAIGINCYESF